MVDCGRRLTMVGSIGMYCSSRIQHRPRLSISSRFPARAGAGKFVVIGGSWPAVADDGWIGMYRLEYDIGSDFVSVSRACRCAGKFNVVLTSSLRKLAIVYIRTQYIACANAEDQALQQPRTPETTQHQHGEEHTVQLFFLSRKHIFGLIIYPTTSFTTRSNNILQQ